nr:reverse transcriptase domain, reverse transcriptase zinc-binding domain protein [Tanacetum cinerariifolium]GEZ55668.1 reverse transcriptase domain, reverse transcriptase zinc-binding domain protein [Tanacetum cinerariifolium]
MERGLRKGDPLSPFLFILAVEALNVVMLEAKNKNIFKGIEVLTRIFTCYDLASGLKVNDNKSKLFGIGVTNLKLNSIGCQPSLLPCIYLGLPIGANMSRCESWSPIVDRFRKRLSMWKAKSLSFGGRLTHINSVLGSLGVYYFSTFKAPIGTVNKLESIRQKFFWGGNLEENKIA